MATVELGEGAVGAHERTLVASTADTVEFEEDLKTVEIVNVDGAAAIYFTVDGSAPTVGGEGCGYLPATPCARVVTSRSPAKTIVRLISTGTPKYSVARVLG
jgi:hypothetical protein